MMTRYQIDKEKYSIDWFTNWFRNALAEKRMTIEQISKATGISTSTITCYRLGVRNPTLRNVLLIVNALGMTIEIK